VDQTQEEQREILHSRFAKINDQSILDSITQYLIDIMEEGNIEQYRKQMKKDLFTKVTEEFHRLFLGQDL
jgi:hypothetical protein